MLGRVLGCSVTDHVWGYFKPVLEASCRFLQTRLCDDDWLACPEQYKKRKINFKCFFRVLENSSTNVIHDKREVRLVLVQILC